MSEFGKDSARNFSAFDHMSTEALEEILRLDIDSDEDSDTDAILYILEVIKKRENEHPTGRLPDVEAAWESFKTNYLPYAGSESLYEDEDTGPVSLSEARLTSAGNVTQKAPGMKSRRLRRIASVAAIMAALLAAGTITAYAAGFDLWGTVARWTKDTFGFASTAPMETSATYSSLQDALSDYGITEPLAPSWIPDGYKLSSIDVSETPATTKFLAVYEYSGDELTISITKIINGSAGTYEKDSDDAAIYIAGNVDHYLMTNEGRTDAVWMYDLYECSISGSITEPDLEKMIDSIYER